MALAVAPATSSSFMNFNNNNNITLFGNNFQFDNYPSSSRKPISQEIIQQYSSLSSEVLEVYEQYNYIHKKMRKKERNQYAKHSLNGFRSHGDFSYQQVRSQTVDWMCQTAEAFRLGNLTVHSAIGFMDLFLDKVPIDPSRLLLVAASSLLIAAKIEEQEPMVPRVAMLHAYCCSSVPSTPSLSFPSFPASFLPKVESLILNHLNWEMVVVTPLHFLEYYLLVSLLPSEVVKNVSETREYLAKMAEFLIDMCEHHSLYREYLPSVVAAAAIATARQMLKISPAWSPALQLISNHSYSDVSTCILNITEHYRQSFAPLS